LLSMASITRLWIIKLFRFHYRWLETAERRLCFRVCLFFIWFFSHKRQTLVCKPLEVGSNDKRVHRHTGMKSNSTSSPATAYTISIA
jgi:hypothetical protein